jgi:hypothetical protein
MRKLVSLVVLLALLTGCSYVRESKHLDFKPFAEYTITLAADIEYGLSRNKVHYLREFINDPALAAHGEMWDGVRIILKGVVAYSVEVTTLGGSTLSGPERCDKFAEFLDDLVRPVLRTYPGVLHADEADLDTLLTNIRSQKDLLGALGQAQPLIDELARVSDQVFDRVVDDLDIITDYLVTKIDSMNADVILFANLVRTGQAQVFHSLVLLGDYRRGDPEALPKLLELDPQLRELIDADDKLTIKEIQAIEERLLFKAQKAREFKEQLAPDLELYRLQQAELADLFNNARRQLTKARITVVVWSRSHRNLAQGIVDPAKVNIFDLTKKAIDTAL